MTSTASSVSTMTRSLTPTSAQRFVARFAVRSRTRLSFALDDDGAPGGVAFPCPSRGAISQALCQLPMSFQSKLPGTTATREAFSMTP